MSTQVEEIKDAAGVMAVIVRSPNTIATTYTWVVPNV